MLQASWSFSGMQTLGFVTALTSALKDRSKRDLVLKEYKGLFNTHPYMASYMIGAMLRLIEEEHLTGSEIKRFKGIGQGTLATSGDLLFWGTLRPAVSLLAVILTLKFGMIGPLAFLIIYNLFHIYHRFFGIKIGYQMGREVVNIINIKNFTQLQKVGEIGGLLLAGFTIPFLVGSQINWFIHFFIWILFILSLIWLYIKRPYGYLVAFLILFLLILNQVIKRI